MKVDEINTKGAARQGGTAPSTGLTSDVLLEAQQPDLAQSSQTGVSTRNAQSSAKSLATIKRPQSERHWYALRATYGKEKTAYEYIINNGGTAYYPTITVDKLIKGRICTVEVSRIPNIFFAYGTEREVSKFVYDNSHLPFLRFYYRHYLVGAEKFREPLIVPDRQMRSLRIVCEAEGEDTIVTSENVPKFRTGQCVRITAGTFTGMEGIVARYKGQQRVGVVIDNVVTAITAYIPSGMMEKVEE